MSTQTTAEVYQPTTIGPGSNALQNYQAALTTYNFGTYLLNSLVMSIAVVIGKVTLVAGRAHTSSTTNSRTSARSSCSFCSRCCYPFQSGSCPLPADGGSRLDEHLPAITGPYIASATAVFLFRQHFRSIPDSLVETAHVDGVGPFRFLVSVLIPMSRSMIAGVCVITFIYSWNQFLWPLIAVTDKPSQVAQVGIRYIQGGPGRLDTVGRHHGRGGARVVAAACRTAGLPPFASRNHRDSAILIPMSTITLTDLTKHYDSIAAVDGIDLDVLDEEFLVVVGPRAVANRRRFGSSLASRTPRPAPSGSAALMSPTHHPRTVTSLWCSRTTPCIHT